MIINFNWNSHVTLSKDETRNYSELNGKAWEFLLPDINPEYRVFRSFYDNNYYIYRDDKLISTVGCSGEIKKYLGVVPKKLFRSLGSEFDNLASGKVKINCAGNKVFIDNEEVAKIGSENRLSWFIKSILGFKFLKFEPWNGIKFNECKLDVSLALTLVISSMAEIDT